MNVKNASSVSYTFKSKVFFTYLPQLYLILWHWYFVISCIYYLWKENLQTLQVRLFSKRFFQKLSWNICILQPYTIQMHARLFPAKFVSYFLCVWFTTYNLVLLANLKWQEFVATECRCSLNHFDPVLRPLLYGQFLTVRCELYQICAKKSWSEFN